MLSRVADSLYWMSRYLERAEHTARLIEVHLNLLLERAGDTGDRRWARVASSLGMAVPAQGSVDGQQLMEALTIQPDKPSSIVACINAARENARQVREQISSEMWEELNRQFHKVKRVGTRVPPDEQLLEFLYAVREGTHLFQGITDSTMNRNEGWQFIQIGRFLERAGATARLLDLHYYEFLDSFGRSAEEFLEWIGLLKSCTAFEAYCKVYTAEPLPDRIAEFLLLNDEFPHSVRFAVDMLQASLNLLPEAASSRKAGRVSRLAGRLRASLSFSQIDEIMGAGLHESLENIQRQCGQIHTAVHQVYIAYPIESALEV